ncbi:hypothetical protein [Sphingopyxis sp. GC21]|uniref:hypothetical protein n=1 Tax=Sphingopyxis sp. GC21 TaxID=2933562 RepID=UPI0029649345|nr:hypothetical protein [Sphingopyxis sp. GC21]
MTARPCLANDDPRAPAQEAAPVIVAWGAGVDSTAMIIEMDARGERIDMVLRARMPERPETEAFIPIFEAWMYDRGIPHETVCYTPKRFKHWPPYSDLLENCLTNGTLPSIAFGRGVCSSKWKVGPQDAWTKAWPPAQRAWARGQKVVRLIGYDCSVRDSQRYAHRQGQISDLFEYRYPLREWGWSREDCELRIAKAGLPRVVASSCWFCTGMTCNEVRMLPRAHLRLIVLMEARAKPRLRTCEGLWRSSTKGLRGQEARPGSMTRFIREQGLLPPREIDRIIAQAPTELLDFLEGAAAVPLHQRPTMRNWLDRFNAGIATPD